MKRRRRTPARVPRVHGLPEVKTCRTPGAAVYEVRGDRSRVRMFLAVDLAALLHGLEDEIAGGWRPIGFVRGVDVKGFACTFMALLTFDDDDDYAESEE